MEVPRPKFYRWTLELGNFLLPHVHPITLMGEKLYRSPHSKHSNIILPLSDFPFRFSLFSDCFDNNWISSEAKGCWGVNMFHMFVWGQKLPVDKCIIISYVQGIKLGFMCLLNKHAGYKCLSKLSVPQTKTGIACVGRSGTPLWDINAGLHSLVCSPLNSCFIFSPLFTSQSPCVPQHRMQFVWIVTGMPPACVCMCVCVKPATAMLLQQQFALENIHWLLEWEVSSNRHLSIFQFCIFVWLCLYNYRRAEEKWTWPRSDLNLSSRQPVALMLFAWGHMHSPPHYSFSQITYFVGDRTIAFL